MNERLTDLEITVMHLERMVEELNEVIYRQQQELDRLVAEVRLLKEQAVTSGVEGVKELGEEAPPPHY